jgi:hypothetical protein
MTSTRHGINWDKALQLHAAERERFIAAPAIAATVGACRSALAVWRTAALDG